MHSDVTSVSAGAGLGAILPLGIGFILAVITPLIAIYTHRRKRDEWRHMNWITALYMIGFATLASGLIVAVMTPSARLRDRCTGNQMWNIVGGIGLLAAILLTVANLLPGP